MLEQILPSCVAVSAVREDILDEDLFPAERAAVERAVEGRRRQFTTGRACARRALVQLGQDPEAIPTGPAGAPRWPAGIVGSITHCDGYRAAALARSRDLLTLGIDAEPNRPLPPRLIPDVAQPLEQGMLSELGAQVPGVAWDRLLFCAKEATYKAWYPLAGRWLGFEDALVTLDPGAGVFLARLLVPGPSVEGHELREFRGRWLARDGLVAAAIAVARRAPGAADF